MQTYHSLSSRTTLQAAERHAAAASEARAAADAARLELERAQAASAGQLREAQARALDALRSVRGEGARLAAELEGVRQQFRAYQALKVGPAGAPAVFPTATNIIMHNVIV